MDLGILAIQLDGALQTLDGLLMPALAQTDQSQEMPCTGVAAVGVKQLPTQLLGTHNVARLIVTSRRTQQIGRHDIGPRKTWTSIDDSAILMGENGVV